MSPKTIKVLEKNLKILQTIDMRLKISEARLDRVENLIGEVIKRKEN